MISNRKRTERRPWFVGCLLLLGMGTIPSLSFAHVAMADLCRQTVIDYAYFRDRPDPDGVAGLFVEDGVFKLGAEVYNGRAAIHKRISAAADGPVFRHMMSTIKILPIDAQSARGVSYAAVYAAAGDELPHEVTDFLALGEYHDEFVLIDDRCQIKRREFIQVMVPGGRSE